VEEELLTKMENFKGIGATRTTLLLVVICSILLFIPMISGMEWDNKKNYNPELREVTVENALGFGDDVAKIKLISPLNVQVARGYNKVAEFNLIYYKDDNGGLDKIDFYNIKESMSSEDRQFDFKIKDYKEVVVNDYEKVCSKEIINGTLMDSCVNELIGNHIRKEVVWNDFNYKDLKKLEEVTIGIFTNVLPGDKIEWIPTFYGVEINEWAVWTEDLNTNLLAYYKLDETSGTNVEDSVNGYNGTNDGATVNQVGKIERAYNFDGNDKIYNTDTILNSPYVTVSGWVNADTWGSANDLIGKRNIVSGSYWEIRMGATQTYLVSARTAGDGSVGSTTAPILNEWIMVTGVFNETGLYLYFDGVLNNSVINTNALSAGGYGNLTIGYQDEGVGRYYFNGTIDEVGIWNRTLSQSEITQLYNSGSGLTYGEVSNIIFNSPADASISNTNLITFNVTAEITGGATLTNISLWTNETGTWGVRNITTGLSGTTHTQTWKRTISEGNYIWNVESCESNGDCEFATSNYTLRIDTTAPTINITYPETSMGYGAIGENETFNWTATDDNLDTCWYEYNNTNTTVTCGDNTTSFELVNGFTNITFYSNDTAGNENSTFLDWTYNLMENSQTYPSTSVESATEIYITNLTYLSSTFSIISGTITINGTEYSGTRTGSGDSAIFTSSVIIPDISTETNFTAYWTIDLTDAGGTTEYNLTSHNVTVSIINLSLCGSPHTVPFWNFTILNESNAAEINSTFDVTFKIKASGSTIENSFSYSDTGENNSQYDFCISPSTENYTVSTDIKLTKSGFVDKFYNFEEVSLTNTTREDNLYMMVTGDSTSFIIHVVDVSGTDIEEAEVRVQRYYPGTDEWLTTEIVTTNYIGEAVGHLLSEDADYRFHVYLSGVSTFNSTATKITCPSTPCTVTLTIPLTISPGYEEVADLDSTLTFSDATNIFTYSYSDSSGSFSRARLLVTRIFPTNSTLAVICNDTKVTADGVMTCNINTGINGTYRASAYITRTGDEFLDARLDVAKGNNIYTSLGEDGVLWGFFLLIGIVMLGITRPSLAIVWGIVGTLFLGISGIIKIGSLSIVAIIAIGIILLMRIGRE